MRVVRPFSLLAACGLMLGIGLTVSSRYRPPAAQPAAPPAQNDLAQLGYDALENHAGVVIAVDPQYGRVLARVSRGLDVQFASGPFEVAQVVTAYAALDAGIIREQTRLNCDAGGEQVNVVDALARPCPAFFAEVSRRLTPAAFKRAAERLGFTYYRAEERRAATRVKPVTARIPVRLSADEFAALAARGVGLEAEDLHFAGLAASLASGVTAGERLANDLSTASRGAVPATPPLNRRALDVVRKGLVWAVDDGTAKAAAHIDHKVAGKAGGDGNTALFVSYAPADAPSVALVVHLKSGLARDAAEVAGNFYRTYFGRRKSAVGSR
jgi:hypothetical protein